jgi:filamentous hemagglutinin family protein
MPPSRSNWYWQLGIVSLLATGSAIASFVNCAVAQITPDATLGNESSQVTPSDDINGQPGTNIDGGAIRGGNLFHSFDEFSVPNGSAAYFNNSSEVQNIINRVTGGNVSNIDGLLKANGAANLFLINPNGIIFGANAKLDIGGSFVGSTASSVKFPDGTEFSATDTSSESLLSVNIPVGLQFGSNPGLIQVQGNGRNPSRNSKTLEIIRTDRSPGLQVQKGQTLALVGGQIGIEGGNVTAEQGRIELGSVSESGNVQLNFTNPGWTLGYEGIKNFQNINLSQAASIDVSGNGAGNIQLQGQRISLNDGSVILANTTGDEPGGILAVKATEELEITGSVTNSNFVSGIFLCRCCFKSDR